MKFGLLVEQDTRNIGDDIQAYATKRFLPRIDYYVDRNHLDEFVPEKEEFVATITNGWFLQYTLNWPPSPYIKPLPISMHFTYKDWFWDTTDKAYHLQEYGLEYLKSIEPIGCRDSHTLNLLTKKGVKTEYTGCMTLTINKFEGIEVKDYICAVDVSDEVVEKIKKTTDMEVKVVTHTVPENYYKLSWDERMKNVEDLLRLYQGARAVVTYRLHCALPCLALGVPVILLNEDYRNDRFGDYTKYIESCSEEDFLSGKVKYDYRNIPTHSDEWKGLRDGLIKRCQEFVSNCEKDYEEYTSKDISLNNYKKYVISKSNWLKNATIESYNRFKEETKKIDEKNKEIEKKNKKIDEKDKEIEIIKNEQINLQNKILEKNVEIENLKDAREYYHKEFNICLEKMENYKKELEIIKSSRWWKIRAKIKGEKPNG